MKLEWQIPGARLQRRYQASGAIDCQKTAGILEIESVNRRGLCQCARAGEEMLVGMDWTDRICERGNDVVAAFGADCAGNGEQRLHVIHGIHDGKAANAGTDKQPKCEPHELRVREFPRNEAHAGGEELKWR